MIIIDGYLIVFYSYFFKGSRFFLFLIEINSEKVHKNQNRHFEFFRIKLIDIRMIHFDF